MTTSPFFSRYPQTDIGIRQYRGKSPMFFPNVHIMGAAFATGVALVREALPDRHYEPLEILPGKALVAIHCMEYLDTDIGPYNEVSLSIPLRVGRSALPSPLLLLRSVLPRSYHAYIKELPVNTEVALYGGLDIFNYPKYRADISFRETAAHRVCTVRDRDSLDLVLEFEGAKIRTREKSGTDAVMTLNTYPRKENRTYRARMLLNQRERGDSFMPGAVSLRLGASARAEPFRRLSLGRPLHYFFAPRCEAALFMPDVF